MAKRGSLRSLLRRKPKPLAKAEPPPLPAPATTPCGLENIPVEMLCAVTEHLTQIDMVALALVSKTLLHRLGKATLRPRGTPRLDILQRLERDGIYPDAIVCRCCQRFHSPMLSLLPAHRHRSPQAKELAFFGPLTLQSRHRRVQQTESRHSRATSPHLPAHVHFNMVAAIMRSHRHHWTAYTPRMLDTNIRHHGGYVPTRMNGFARCYIVAGRLVLAEQRLILPIVSAGSHLDTVACMSRVLGSWPGGGNRICAHRTWLEEYPFLFPEKDPEADDPGRAQTTTRNTHCAWTHKQPCRGPGVFRRACHTEDLRAGAVGGCAACYTDFAYAMLDLPRGGGRVVALATWKDLGAGESLADTYWQSHLPRKRKGAGRAPEALGSIYGAVAREVGWKTGSYRPVVDEVCFYDLMRHNMVTLSSQFQL